MRIVAPPSRYRMPALAGAARLPLGLALAFTLGACVGQEPVPDGSETAAREAALTELVNTHQTLALADELLQFDPLLDCLATPEANASAVAAFAQQQLGGCGRITAAPGTVTVDFGPAPGCTFGFGLLRVSGRVTLTISRAAKTLVLRLELTGVVVNGQALSGVVPLETQNCNVFVVKSPIGASMGDLVVTGKKGEFVVDGTLDSPPGAPAGKSTLTGVSYRPGDCYPSAGQLKVENAGSTQTIEFDSDTGRSGVARLLPSGARFSLAPYGRCPTLPCGAGTGDCDGDKANGCEHDLTGDIQNCGACGRVCAPPNAYPACRAGACAVADCMPGYGDCDKQPANGCEVDRRTDVRSCGTCGRVCTIPNGTPKCFQGECYLLACDAGFSDCDGDAANGCETRLSDDKRNCGRCGTVCSVGQNASAATCVAGMCGNLCSPGFGDCDGRADNGCEAASGTSVNNCGACGVVCMVQANAMAATCVAGTCGNVCNPGRGDCDGQPANGCETASDSDVNHCGGCGNACPLRQNAMASRCQAGVCGSLCSPGFADCNAVAVDGCEVNLNSDVNRCGACNRQCVVANATPACRMGACAIGMCNAGFGDCDSDPANGCEINITVDVNHCGRCGGACMVPHAMPACRMGACGIASCDAGFGDCNNGAGDGCETNTTNSVAHCGACARPCVLPNATPVCAMSACAISSCDQGFANCNNSSGDGCEINITNTVGHCGGCGRACALAHATPRCQNSACAIASCDAGFRDCNNTPGDGCEFDVRSDVMNCGGCGTVCPMANMGARCVNSVCVAPACNDLVKNGLETDVDCGGNCPRCAANKVCVGDADCVSGYCKAGRCTAELVAYWPFSEGVNSPTTADASGNNNVGTLRPPNAMPSPWTAQGKVGNALDFHQAQMLSHVEVAPSGSLDPLGMHITVAAWITADSLSIYNSVVMKTDSAAWNTGYGIYADGNGHICGFANAFFGGQVCAPFAVTGSYHHVALTYDGATLRFYLDKVETERRQVNNASAPSAAPLLIGHAGYVAQPTWSWDGRIDEVRIYNGALTAAELANL